MLNTISEVAIDENNAPLTRAQSDERKRMDDWLKERIAIGKKRPTAEVITLVPSLAKLLLERNPANRPIGRYNTETLTADVASKRWEFNGESIVVSRDGILLDGQHRCTVVAATGISIETVIVFGPREEARYTIDIGKPKSAANFLHMKGWKDTNHLSAAISMLLQYRKTGAVVAGYLRPTKTEIVQAAGEFKGISDSVEFVADATKRRLGSRSALAFCHFIFWKRASRELADSFMRQLIDGDGLRKGGTIYYCRERLIGLGRGARPETRAELVIKTWNAWRRGDRVTKIVLNGSFPKLER